jgi:DNA-directed RNA polymerase alpha subunit
MIETFHDVTERLDRLAVAYMVTGSFAMGVYATARTTLDIDIVVEITRADIARFVAAFENDFYVQDSSIIRAIEHHSMFNMISNTTSLKVDCIVRKDTPTEKAKFERRSRGHIGDHEFWAISQDDLILSKLAWARESLSERQFEDIERLLEKNADLENIVREVEKQDLAAVWDEFQKWKIRKEQ